VSLRSDTHRGRAAAEVIATLQSLGSHSIENNSIVAVHGPEKADSQSSDAILRVQPPVTVLPRWLLAVPGIGGFQPQLLRHELSRGRHFALKITIESACEAVRPL